MYKYVAKQDSGIDMTTSDSQTFDDVIDDEDDAITPENNDNGGAASGGVEEGSTLSVASSSEADERADDGHVRSGKQSVARKRVSFRIILHAAIVVTNQTTETRIIMLIDSVLKILKKVSETLNSYILFLPIQIYLHNTIDI